jgi:hypothetical protein
VGAWGAGVLENDSAWDYVGDLLREPAGQRASAVVSSLERVADAEWLDVDDASGALVAVLIVAAARGPENLAADRLRLVEHAAATADIDGFDALVGPLATLRAAAVAQTASRAIVKVRQHSEVADLWGDDADLSRTLDELAAALRAPLQRWKASDLRSPKVAPLRRSWALGSLLGIDLGNGSRSCAQMLRGRFMAFYDGLDAMTAPPPSAHDVVSRPVLFTVGVNEFCDRPAGWRTIGEVPRPEDVLPIPTRYRQDLADPEKCALIVDDDWSNPVPVTQRECIGLEPAGMALSPELCEERIRNHYAGERDVHTELSRVRISRSFARVLSTTEVEEAVRVSRLPAAEPRDDGRPLFFYDVADVATHAAAYGAGRDDLVVLDLDEARMPQGLHYFPPDRQEPDVAPSTHWNPVFAIRARYTLIPDENGGYRLDPPWSPRHP